MRVMSVSAHQMPVVGMRVYHWEVELFYHVVVDLVHYGYVDNGHTYLLRFGSLRTPVDYIGSYYLA